VKLDNIFNNNTLIVFILAGSKTVQLDDKSYFTASAGQLIAISPREFISVENKPNKDKAYKALCISYPDIDKLINDQHQVKTPFSSSYQFVKELPKELINSILSLDSFLYSDTVPDAIKYHKAMEPLVWLQALGVNLNFRSENSLYGNVKELLESDLSYRWQVSEVAEKFFYSDATLKRKLQNVGTSFTKILLNTRLEHGLFLLQTSDKAIAQVSLDCGFSTPSHFSAAFKKRFYIAPKEIRIF
jgi:AraC-like DNA-binding protein